jgi:hypothetical protein
MAWAWPQLRYQRSCNSVTRRIDPLLDRLNHGDSRTARLDLLPLISGGGPARRILECRTVCHIGFAPIAPEQHTMTVVERTSAGLQTVIPGCERRTLPKSTTRVDESGQGLLHFYKPSSLREQLARRADAPLLPKRGQKALPKSGLFVS